MGRRGIFNGFFSHFRQRRFFGFWMFVIQVNESVATGNAGGSLANLLRIGQACPIIFTVLAASFLWYLCKWFFPSSLTHCLNKL